MDEQDGSRFIWKVGSNEELKWALFRHYTTIRMLRASAKAGCQLCCKMLECTHPEDDDQVAFAFRGEPFPEDHESELKDSHRYTFMICPVRPLATEFSGRDGFIFELILAKDKSDCLRMPFEGHRTLQRCPSLSPKSDDCFRQISKWLGDCTKKHSLCRRKALPLPTRLLDLGFGHGTPTSADDGEVIRLVAPPDKIRYVALSYCWGELTDRVTTTENLAGMMAGIALDDLPATIRDAVYVCRRCHIQYLWVDVLCICQNDKAEWEMEVSNMANVYGGSEFTISALASSKTSEPFLKERHLEPVALGTVKASYGTWDDETILFLRGRPRSLEDEFDSAAMNQRAWTLQEKILAPAVLHYGRDQVIWECDTGHLRSETGQISKEGELVIRTSDIRGADSSSQGVMPLWDCVLGEYTKRKLTFAGDRLVAVAGVASKLRKDGASRGRYVAGLWEDGLETQLAWHIDEIPRNKFSESMHPESQFPTWSWACRDLPISTALRCYSALEGVAKFIFLDAEQERRSQHENSARHCAIGLRGWMHDVSERAICQDSQPVDRQRGYKTFPGLPGEDSRILLDQEPMPRGPCYALRILERPDLVESDGLVSRVFYLLLQEWMSPPMPGLDNCYARVGVLSLCEVPSEYFARPYPDAYCKNGQPLLTNGRWQDVTLL